MRKILILFLMIGCLGCTLGQEKISGYMDDPKTIFQDPLTVSFERDLENLEREYLRGKISYAEYMNQKKILKDDYTQAVKNRQDIIESQKER